MSRPISQYIYDPRDLLALGPAERGNNLPKWYLQRICASLWTQAERHEYSKCMLLWNELTDLIFKISCCLRLLLVRSLRDQPDLN
jgi:hypothetical protein